MTDLTPGREQFRDLAADGPVVVRVAADLAVDVPPLSAYAALSGRTTDRARSPYAFLLESAAKTAGSDPDGAFRADDGGADRHARFSFVGYDPALVVSVTGGEREVRRLRGGTGSPDSRSDDATASPPGDAAAGGWADRVSPPSDEADALDLLRGVLPDVPRRGFPDRDRRNLEGGLVGFLSYDAVYDVWLSEVGRERPDSPVPDAEFVLADRVLAFDEVAGTVTLVRTLLVGADDDPDAVYDAVASEAERVAATLAAADPPEPGGFVRTGESAGPREDYEAAVRSAKEHVRDGDVYQAVLSRTRELRGDVDALGLYAALREVNPSPYMYLLAHDDHSVVGASPEALVSVQGRTVRANPIAGTCERGTSPVEDRRRAGEMLADDKELAEHTMLVDLARNDVRRVSAPGTVRVEEFMAVRKYSHVQHIESTVRGLLPEGPDAPDAFDAIRATFPAGTLAGAPKVRAMEILDDLEASPRGVYGGGVGYVSLTGDADVAIVIRSATVDSAGEEDRITVRAGAGIVADSDPAAEYEETERKMDGVLAAIERIEDDGAEEGDGVAGDEDGAGSDGDATPDDPRPTAEREADR